MNSDVLKSKTILVVEDGNDYLLIKRWAKRSGLTNILRSSNVDDAAKKLNKLGGQIDMVMIDIKLTDNMPGTELVYKISQNKKLSHIKIVLMSGDDSLLDAAKYAHLKIYKKGSSLLEGTEAALRLLI